jgi:hypothetical protein
MKYPYLFLTVALLFVLACGVQAPLTATDPAPATQTPSNVPDVSNTPYDVVIPSKTPHVLIVLGEDTTWNLRSCASTDCETVGIAHGGQEFAKTGILGAWVKVDDVELGPVWICGKAFGSIEECE